MAALGAIANLGAIQKVSNNEVPSIVAMTNVNRDRLDLLLAGVGVSFLVVFGAVYGFSISLPENAIRTTRCG